MTTARMLIHAHSGCDKPLTELSDAFMCLQWLRRYAAQEEAISNSEMAKVVSAMSELNRHIDSFRAGEGPTIDVLVEEIRHIWMPRLSIYELGI
ncbi:MAG TPA: hypothetical protein VNF75_07865 [Candidatus Dormibacteraeota bacterium]|nr:hypothetical protein [Candidatus Dormibacteraeota bacterium]